MKFSRDLVPTIDDLGTRQRTSFPEIEDEEFWSLYETCKHFSLLHVPGFYNLFQSMKYLERHRLEGVIVECGCFLGGAAAFMGLMRKRLRLRTEIWLFDTFEGPPIGSTDMFVGTPIETPALLPNYEKQVKDTIKDVVGSTADYRFVVGLVEDTVPPAALDSVSLLRLDTDFYSSTKVELEILYPKLVPGGVLIVDDYGSFQGARKATDEYLGRLKAPPLLNRIDLGIWSGVKPGDHAAEAISAYRDCGSGFLRRLFR